MSTSFIEKYPQNKISQVSIRPYFDPSVENMGLEQYGLSVFDGAMHEEPVACVEQFGILRFITGLNEHAPEVKSLPEDERIAKVKQIRVIVAQLEKELKMNTIDPESENFWDQVQLLKPNNAEFWNQIKIRVSNEPVFLDPKADPYDLIKLMAIEAGGFSLVASSLEDAKTRAVPARFYLDKLEDTLSTRTEVKKLRNKALAELERNYNKNVNKLFYICKVVDPNSAQYKKSTPNDILYDNMDRFINGDLVERDKRKSADKFLTAAKYDMETLKIKAIVKDASWYRMITTKADGFIYSVTSGNMLGKNLTEVEAYLKNPLNEEELKAYTQAVEAYWNA